MAQLTWIVHVQETKNKIFFEASDAKVDFIKHYQSVTFNLETRHNSAKGFGNDTFWRIQTVRLYYHIIQSCSAVVSTLLHIKEVISFEYQPGG
jgi:hypothetical protein